MVIAVKNIMFAMPLTTKGLPNSFWYTLTSMSFIQWTTNKDQVTDPFSFLLVTPRVTSFSDDQVEIPSLPDSTQPLSVTTLQLMPRHIALYMSITALPQVMEL
ncbi:hypothetical protein FRC14_000830 [Serendipita sp. 396]|nr:hypothetical protein FRC14_000830 [Serendipita sp. 396]KAG8776329.1 hypothetical protein FRC15_012001 [Serendipita sp. 397]KAG8790165.1 hypothetical protein FRC16_001014 [Serendipita sp. 398]KAG8857473.1 hypothetical protein FRC20_000274 [Serendipita sp. 405]